MTAFLVFFFNFLFQIMRTYSVYVVVEKSVFKTGIFAFIIQVLWITSMGLGISEGIIAKDYFVICMFILGGTLGAVISVIIKRRMGHIVERFNKKKEKQPK